MMVPFIHLNGTSHQTLLEQTDAAFRAVTGAIEALQVAAPNHRDYYPRGDAAWRQVLQEHRTRLEALERVRNELNTILIAICEVPL